MLKIKEKKYLANNRIYSQLNVKLIFRLKYAVSFQVFVICDKVKILHRST